MKLFEQKNLVLLTLKKKYNINEISKGDVIFCASGVTTGDLTKGIKNFENRFEVTTLALHKSQGTNKIITNTYKK